ncbi:MAG TPA: 2-hydroxyacid dehydrogenase [Xanthobacteraceae bacterium]|nr:2-hydroxyacid dehydrogenase [Xanthobacteraceae bacterium]
MTDRRKPRLLAVSQIPPDLRAALAQRYELADHAALQGGAAPGFDIAVTMSMHGVNAAQMDNLPDLKLIACNGAGLERIDLAEARRRGIAVCHTPDELAEDVADGAIALTYAIMRRVVEADRFVRAGRWMKERMAPSRRLAGKTVGIVGLGKIGRLVARRAEAIGMRVLYLGRKPKADVPYPFVADLLELAEKADVLILSCPGGEATRNLVGEAVLERLGRDGYLINVSRGSVVDEPALIAALQNGKIAGAALDVFASEPNIDPRFLALDNVVLQPHSASITHETRAAMLARLLGDIESFVEGRPFHDAAALA